MSLSPFQRLLALCRIDSTKLEMRAMLEQGYWALDPAVLDQRPDLKAGHSLFGDLSKPEEVLLTPVEKAEAAREEIEGKSDRAIFFSPHKKIHWSLEVRKGESLLDPQKHKIPFLFLALATLQAAQDHAALLSALLDVASIAGFIHLSGAAAVLVQEAVHKVPPLVAEPLLEFRNAELSFRAGPSEVFTLQVFNGVVADRLTLLLDRMDDLLSQKKGEPRPLLFAQFFQSEFEKAWPILMGDRGEEGPKLSLLELCNKKTVRALQGVISSAELQAQVHKLIERKARTIEAEAHLIIEVFEQVILPSLGASKSNPLVDQSIRIGQEIEQLSAKTKGLGWQAKAAVFSELVYPKMEELRQRLDALAGVMGPARWPLPPFRKLW